MTGEIAIALVGVLLSGALAWGVAWWQTGRARSHELADRREATITSVLQAIDDLIDTLASRTDRSGMIDGPVPPETQKVDARAYALRAAARTLPDEPRRRVACATLTAALEVGSAELVARETRAAIVMYRGGRPLPPPSDAADEVVEVALLVAEAGAFGAWAKRLAEDVRQP